MVLKQKKKKSDNEKANMFDKLKVLICCLLFFKPRMRPVDLFLDRKRWLSCPHTLSERGKLSCLWCISTMNPRQNTGPTDELLPQLVSLPEIVSSEDEGVDDAEHGGHVWGVFCGLQLIHDHTEAVVLHLHVLEDMVKWVQPHASGPCVFPLIYRPTWNPLGGAIDTLILQGWSYPVCSCCRLFKPSCSFVTL